MSGSHRGAPLTDSGAVAIAADPHTVTFSSEERMGSVVKKRRKKIRKHKYKKLRKRMRHRNR